eukprot:49642-Chlamydomonas_euryale.AAC.1
MNVIWRQKMRKILRPASPVISISSSDLHMLLSYEACMSVPMQTSEIFDVFWAAMALRSRATARQAKGLLQRHMWGCAVADVRQVRMSGHPDIRSGYDVSYLPPENRESRFSTSRPATISDLSLSRLPARCSTAR